MKMTKKQNMKEENSSKEKPKRDEEILFPEAKVGDITVKPWSFGMLFDISGSLEKVLDKIEDKKVDLTPEGGFIPYTTFARLFTIAGPEVLKIISLTIDMPENEVKDLDMDTGVKIAMIIYQQNRETIKNALTPLLKQKNRGARKNLV